MWARIAAFFSNGGYATWAQSLIVVVSVIVAVFSIRDARTNLSVTNAVGLAQKYFTEKPSLASSNLRLRISQYSQVQEAKKVISAYDQQKDKAFDQLFEVARPLVLKKIKETVELQSNYDSLNDFFSGMLICISAKICDADTSVKLLGWEVLGFYNAVCPYMEDAGHRWGHDEESPRYIGFLVDLAGYKDSRTQYFCREKLAHYLTTSQLKPVP